MKNYVALGDLVLDIYHDSTFGLLGYYGGGSAWNTLFNIANIDPDANCYCIATCGDDWAGDLAVKHLESVGINTSYVRRVTKPTKKFNVIVDGEKTRSQLECPACREVSWYSNAVLPTKVPTEFTLTPPGVVIIDNPKKNVLNLARAFRQQGWLLAADIGYINHLRYMSKEDIKSLLKSTIDLFQTNCRVCKFLLNQFDLSGENELYSFLGCRYMNITDGSRGSRLFYTLQDGSICETKVEAVPAVTTDPTGAGDAFFSKLLCSLGGIRYFKGDIQSTIQKASQYAAARVQVIGARGQVVKTTIPGSDCRVCGKIIKEIGASRPQLQRIATNTNHLLDRILRALESTAVEKLQNVLSNINNYILMVGTGGSFTAANFAAKVINRYSPNVISLACKPRDVIMNSLDKVEAVFLFSYSGKTKDIQKVYGLCKQRKVPVYVITKYDPRIDGHLYEDSSVISYNTAKVNTKERGFISMAGTLIPMCLYSKIFFNKTNDDFLSFLKTCFKSRSCEFSKKNTFFQFRNHKLIVDIFSGADTSSAAVDLESKFTESGLGRVVIHEKKDFSHGRFNIVEKFAPDLVIYLENETGTYSKTLFSYLKKRDHLYVCRLTTSYQGVWGDFDLVIATQFFLKYLSKAIGYDMAKPGHPEDAMTLYRYAGNDLY